MTAPEQWWITTDVLSRGGTKIAGPFPSQDAALDARSAVELERYPSTFWVDSEPAPAADGTVTVTLELPQRVADLLAVLAPGDPAPLHGALLTLIDHAQQGIYRPGAWERGWLEQAFGDDWQAGLEPDTDDTAMDGRVIFERPIRPCPNDPPCEHPESAHEAPGPLGTWCLDCDCGDEGNDGADD